MKNKAFFFGNLDLRTEVDAGSDSRPTARRARPGGVSMLQACPPTWRTFSRSSASRRASMDTIPGRSAKSPRRPMPTKIFVRADFNVSSRHQLTARVNYVNSSRQLTTNGVPATTAVRVSPAITIRQKEKVFSPVVQLNTTFSHAFNELRFAYTRDRFGRNNPGLEFVSVRAGRSSRRPERPAGHRELLPCQQAQSGHHRVDRRCHVDQGQAHDHGRHAQRALSLLETCSFKTCTGQWEFFSIQNFHEQVLAQFYSHGFSNTADPQQPAEFSVQQFGGYVGDQWRVKPSLTLTYGVRLDVPHFPDRPHAKSADRRGLRIADRCRAGAQDVVTANRLQLGPKQWRREEISGARRCRLLYRPDALRVAVEPIRQHRRRFRHDFHQHGGREPNPVRRGSKSTADQRHRREQPAGRA